MNTVAETSERSSKIRKQRRAWPILVGSLLVVVVAVGSYVVLNRSADDKPPYIDPAATGTLTLCSSDGKEVTEGKVSDAPFADLVVGSSSAPSAYANGLASLFAYQPRVGHDASEFSGQPLTAGSTFTDAAHPAAEVTEGATTLGDHLQTFPATWDGYVQLRLILTSSGAPARTTEYDAADILVDGTEWKLVRGGGGDCAKALGTAHLSVTS